MSKDPKKGTGKKPKGSSRRLYTDENPKDTCRVRFTSVSAIRQTFSSSCFKSKPHARQSQIINLVHQRVRAAHNNAKDPKVKKRLKRALEYAEKRKESSKKKTERLKKMKKKSSNNQIELDLRKSRIRNILLKESELDRWFKEKWVDISKKDKSGKHPPCGRADADSGKYPKCRPSKRVNKKTPTTSKELSKKEKTKAVKKKRKVEKTKPNKPAGGGARKPKTAPKVRKRRLNKKSSGMPFSQIKISDSEFIRKFDPRDKEDFVWHRDHEDREITVLSGKGWSFQFDNQLPIKLFENKKIFIPKNSWHKVLAGETNLNIIVKESGKKKDEFFFKENLDYDENYLDKLKKRVKKRKIKKKAYEGQTFTSNGVTFDVSQVWAYCEDIKPKKTKVSDIEHLLKDKCWDYKDKRISPMEVLDDQEKYAEHFKRTNEANLDFAIVIWNELFLEKSKNKTEYIQQEDCHVVDGLHRLLKAYSQGFEHIDIVELENEDMKDILTDIYINSFEDLVEINLDLSEVFLDSPIGSKKGFGSEKRKLPFDYGEFSNFTNPSDDMGWDIIVVPSNSEGIVNQHKHNYAIVGIVEVNEDEETWVSKAGKSPPYGNHKVIVANFGKYSEEDVAVINNFFKNMWQFKNPKFF